MPRYKVNEKYYNIPDDKAEGFEKKYPSAMVSYVNGKDVYEIDIADRKDFLEQFPDAQYYSKQVKSQEEVQETVPKTRKNIKLANFDLPTHVKPKFQRPGSETSPMPDEYWEMPDISSGEIDPLNNELQEKDGMSMNREQVGEMFRRIDTDLNSAIAESMAAYQQEEEKAREGGFWKQMQYALAHNAGHGGDTGATMMRESRRQLKGAGNPELHERIASLQAAKKSLTEAQRIIDEADHNAQSGTFGKWLEQSFAGGAARGFGQKLFDVSTWDMGMSDLENGTALMTALDAYDNGKPLTESQQALLDAKAVELATNAYFGSYVGRGYKAGSVTAQSIPFMLEMCINPASSIGKSATSRMARYAIQRFGKNAAKSTGHKILRAVGRVGADIAGAATMAATTGSIRTAADAVTRMSGHVETDINEDGHSFFAGHERGDDAATAFAKAFGATTIENYSEMFGEYFSPILGLAGSKTGKAMEKVGLGKVNRFIADVKASDIAKAVADFERHSHWNGMIGEYAEEVAGGIMNALVVGDQTLDTDKDTGVFNLSNNIDTFLGVSLMGGVLSGIKTAGYRTPKYKARKALQSMSNKAGKVFDADSWQAIKDGIDYDIETGGRSSIENIIADAEVTEEQKKAAMMYAQAGMHYKGVLEAEAKRRTDEETDPVMTDLETSFDNGYGLESGQEMNDARNMLDFMTEQLKEKLGIEDATVDDALFMNENGLAEEQKNILIGYLNAKATYEGVIQHVRDDIDGRIEAAHSEIDRHTNNDTGRIHTAVTTDGRQVYVVGGNIVMDKDGAIDRSKSDQDIIIMDRATGTREFWTTGMLQGVDVPIDPADEKNAVQEEIRQKFAREAADKIDGKVTFNAGDVHVLTTPEGQQFPVQITANAEGIVDNGDGTVNVIVNNAADSNGQPIVSQMTMEEIQQMSEATNVGRLVQYEQEKVQKKAAEVQAPEYRLNDTITLNTGEHGPVSGFITASADADGRFEVFTELPVNGRKVNMFTREELDSMVMELNGEKTGSQIQEQETQANSEKEMQAAPEETPEQAGAEHEGSDMLGRSLSEQEAGELITRMESNAVTAPDIELTPENWTAEFGKDGIVETPVGKVKMGENQYVKMAQNGRNGKLGMVKPTLEVPDVIIKDYRPAMEGKSERDTSYVFVKSFANNDGSRHYHFTSVTVLKDGHEVVISNQEKSSNRISKLLQSGEITWINPKNSPYPKAQVEKSVSLSDSSIPTSSDNQDAWLGINSPVSNNKGNEISGSSNSPEGNFPVLRNPSGYVLPQKADGSVDQAKLWNDSPAEWCVFNDRRIEQKFGQSDGGKSSKDYVQNAISRLEKEIKSAEKALAKESDFDKREKIEDSIVALNQRLKVINEALSGYNAAAPAHTTASSQQREKKASEAKRAAERGFPAIKDKWDSARKIDGIEDEIVLPDGETIKGRYVLTEANAPTPSHNPHGSFSMTEGFPVDENGKTINDRDYENDGKAQAIVLERAKSYDQRALQSPVIVSDDGIVLSGNDRTMASQLAAENGTDGRYVEYLSGHAAKYGFNSEQVTSFSSPRVVFVPNEKMSYNAETFAKFNKSDTKTQNRTEKAVKAGKVANEETLSQIATVIDRFESINDVYRNDKAVGKILEILSENGIITKEQFPELLDGAQLSGSGQDFIESFLIGNVLHEDALRTAMEDRSIRKSVLSAMAQIFANRSIADYNLTTELSDAIILIARAKSKGKIKIGEDIGTFMKQLDLFGDNPIAEATVQLLANAINDTKTGTLKKIMSLYNPEATLASQGQLNMFSGDIMAKEELLTDILKQYGYDTRTTETITGQPGEDTARNSSGETAATAQSNADNKEIKTDNQGNPVDINGKLIAEQVQSVSEITDEDFTSPSRSVELPTLPDNVAEAIGVNGRRLIIKRNVFIKNRDTHKDLSPEDSRRILAEALYNPQLYGQNRKQSRPYNWLLIHLADKNSAVLVEVNHPDKDNMEIVNWHYLNEKQLRQKERQAEREGGLILALSNDNAAGDTSISLSSDSKGSEISDNTNDGKKTSVQEAIETAREQVDTEPTDAQKEAGNYRKGHVKIDGHDITIEQPKGSIRRGKDASGKEWQSEMHNNYGYIRGTESVDGDHIDIFLSDSPEGGDAFVVDQVNKDGSFDEHKVMYGFTDEQAAREAYLSNYEKGWTGLGAITRVSKEDFKKWIDSSTRKTKPFAEYASIQESKTKAQSTNLLDVVRDLYNKGKEYASKMYQRSYFDVAQTPDFMKKIGLSGDKFTIKYGVISRHFDKDTSHSLPESVWKELPNAIQNPFAITKRSDKKAGYRIYTTIKTDSGYVVIGADVKNAGKNLEVNSISTIFGRDKGITENEEVVYTGKEITPEQQSLLERPNSSQYTAEQESSDSKGNEISGKSNGLTNDQAEAIAMLQGKTPEQVRAEHEEARRIPLREKAKAWEQKLGIPVNIIESFDKTDNAEARKAIESGNRITGWYEPSSGKVCIYIPHCMDIADIDKTYMHEIVAHKGLRGLLGEENFSRLCDKVWDIMPEEDRKKFMAYPGVNSNRRAAADEYVANMAETVNFADASDMDRSAWEKIVSFIKGFLDSLGLDISISEKDITDLLVSSYRKLESESKKGGKNKPDGRLDDFGEKIGGARKDVVRDKIRDSARLSDKDIEELKEPDKILSRSNIIKSFEKGTMTKEDAQSLLALNMAVRGANSMTKPLALIKYRELAIAWERGEKFLVGITEKDIDNRISQIHERARIRPDIRKETREFLEHSITDVFYDYVNTYRALEYPAVNRKLGSAYIRRSSYDGRYWVIKSPGAARGYVYDSMSSALSKMKALYPEIIQANNAEGKDKKAPSSDKVGHIYITKDKAGWHRLKSRDIPGDIYLSGKFYSKADAEEYLKEHAEALVNKESRMAEALMGSNIGMVQREGIDYRNGKDVTPQDFLDKFAFRGVEFGNWVPQAERQLYLNKTYDAIMDFCSIVGISPKAFSLGGRLGLAFGARGHSKALAHYESLKEVINLTRMKGAGALAHEWFHALDNYLARQKTGNTTDFATDTKNAMRKEVADAFQQFVEKMNSLDYSRRSRNAGDYWNEVWERAARLFESYIYNELGGKGVISPLLVSGHSYVENGEEGNYWPYPTAEEDKEIKPYFDNIFSTIQEEVKDDGNVVLFRSNGTTDNRKTLEDVLDESRTLAEKHGWNELASYPDITNGMLEDAVRSGRITVHSDSPISNGVTVTPSLMHANELAGGAEVFSKEVDIDDVSWTDTDKGEYAKADNDIRFRMAEEENKTDEYALLNVKDKIEDLFYDALEGKFSGKPVSIGKLTSKGRKYLQQISGIELKEDVDFVLNPSDLKHIYNDHFGNNEKDTGSNIPLDITDIRNIANVISKPDRIIFSLENASEGNGRKRFFFLKSAEKGAYNLLEIYADKKGNLTSKSFYKTKKGVSRRAMTLNKSLNSTSETSEATLSAANIPIIFDNPSPGDIRFRMAESDRDFDALRERAVAEKGIVMPGLADKEVKVVEVPRHDFTGTGKQAIDKARKWAEDNLIGTHTAKHGTAEEFEYNIDTDVVGKYLSSSSTKGSDNLGVHLAVMKHLPDIINESIDAEIHPDYPKAQDRKRSADNGINESNILIHRMYGAAMIDGIPYRVKTTLKEYRDSQNAKPYNYQVTELELLISGSEASDALSNSNSVTGAKLLQGVEKSYDKGVKLLDKSQKANAVSENSDTIRYRSMGGKVISYRHDGELTQLREGEFSLVERQFRENGYFNFSGGKIRSADDVAYIFRNLEDASIENAFAVLVTKGKPTIVHIGMGAFNYSVANIGSIRAAYDAFGAEQIYLVHNHPSGQLEASQQDRALLTSLRKMFPSGVVQPGIIINLNSGKYGTFGEESYSGSKQTIPAESKTKEHGITVLEFDKQVFSPDFDITKLKQVRSPEDIAAILSSQRLGEREKMGALILNNANQIVGNLPLTYGNLTQDVEGLGEELASLGVKYGGTSVIPYGNFKFDSRALNTLQRLIQEKSGDTIRLLDSISVTDGLRITSAMDEGMMEPDAEYSRRQDDSDAGRAQAIMALEPIHIEKNNLSRDELRAEYAKLPSVHKDGRKIDFYKSAFKKIYKEGGLFGQIVPSLDKILEQSILAYSESDNRGGTARPDGTIHKSHPNTAGFDNYIGKIQIQNEKYYVRSTIQNDKDNRSGMHSCFVTNVEIYKNAAEVDNGTGISRVKSTADSIIDAKLQQFFERANAEERKGINDFKNPNIESDTEQQQTLKEQVNEQFNGTLEQLTEENSNSVRLDLGYPSEMLLSSGIEYKPLILYGNKLIKKAKKHGFDIKEVMNLPLALNKPIAVFSGSHADSFAILTEIMINGDNTLVTIETDKKGEVDINLVSSVFGKGNKGVIKWILDGKLKNVNKEKVQSYISASALIADATYKAELLSAAKIINNFKNPSIEGDTEQQQTLQEQVKEFGQSLGENVRVIEDISSITDSDESRQRRMRNAKGWFDPATGETVIVLPNAASAADAKATVFHEVVGHKGVRAVVGERKFEHFLEKVFRGSDKETRERIMELARKHGWDIGLATEEYIAHLAESGIADRTGNSFWERVRDFFTDMLHQARLALGFRITDNDLKYLLWRSWQMQTSKGAIAVAENVEMQRRMKVGNYRDRQLCFRDADEVLHDRAIAREHYERAISSGLYQFRESVQDSMLGLRELMQSVLKAEGKGKVNIEDVASFENAYLAENAMSSMSKAEQEAYYNLVMSPLMKAVAELNAPQQEIMDYMMAKHGLERNILMAEREAKETEKADTKHEKTYQEHLDKARKRDYAGLTALTGMDSVAAAEAEARNMVNAFEASHDTSDLWNKVNAATKASLSKLYECGMMTRKAYEETSRMYQFYIPLRGWDETTSDEVYGYLTGNSGILNSPLKKAEGRRSKADNPLAYIASMADAAIMQGNRNRMKQRFMNFVLNHPSDLVGINDLWLSFDDTTDSWKPVFADLHPEDTSEEVEQKTEAFNAKMEQLAKTDPYHYRKGHDAADIPYKVAKGNLSEHQVLVKRGGRPFVITVNGNPRAAQALNGLTNPDTAVNGFVGSLINAGQWINRNLSAAYTTRNVEFVVSNFLRDMLYSNCMTWVKENPRYALRFHKNFGKYNPRKMASLFSKWEKGTLDESNGTEKMFKQFMINGGETGYTDVKDIDRHKKEIARQIRKFGRTMPIGKALDFLGSAFDIMNRSVENCARFAAFATSREMGRSLERSIYDAKEVSVNFNKKGSGDRFTKGAGMTLSGKIGANTGAAGKLLYVFWNAGVQGFTNFGRNVRRHPAKALTGIAAMFSLGVAVAALAGAGGDDDDKNAYYNLPEHTRRSNICFRAGKAWITIPLPIEFRSIYGIGELAMGVISGKEHYSDSELAYQMASQLSQILPLDMLEGGGGFAPLIPSAAKPFSEAYIMNEGWTGLPVYNETYYNKNMPEWTKAYKSANSQLVSLAETANRLSGGDDFTKGTVDINPARVEYMLNGYLGGYATLANKLVKMGETATGKRDFEWRNMLIASRVVKSGDERTEYRKLTNEFYNLKEEYEKTGRRLRGYEDKTDEGIAWYAEKLDFLYNSPEYLRYEIFDEYGPDIDAIRAEMKEETDPDLFAELEGEMYSLMRELVDSIHKAEEKRAEEKKDNVTNGK